MPKSYQFWVWLALSLVLLGVAILAILSYVPIRGFQVQEIVSGSMEPALSKGSMVLTRRDPGDHYQVGEVVTFRVTTPVTELITHRIVRVYVTPGGVPVMETRGDDNSSGDPWITPLGAVVGKVVWVVPVVGYTLTWVKTQAGFLVFTVLFFLFSVSYELTWLFRYSWQMMRRIVIPRSTGTEA